jgi:hypothetical protein
MLYKGIVTIKKGQIKRLHQNAKRAQFVNAIVRAGRHFEHVFLAHSISEAQYETKRQQAVKPTHVPQLSLAI